MPTNDTNNQNNQNTEGFGQDDTQDASAGDILEQLKSESANSSNIYKLELKMYRTMTSIDKAMTKEYKLFIQGSKTLDSMNSTLSSIKSDTKSSVAALTSVDTNLRNSRSSGAYS